MPMLMPRPMPTAMPMPMPTPMPKPKPKQTPKPNQNPTTPKPTPWRGYNPRWRSGLSGMVPARAASMTSTMRARSRGSRPPSGR